MKLKTPKDLAIKARMMGKKTISYSQLNMYKGCPLQWKLTYIDRHREYDPSMFLVFGTAMHEVLQHYLTTMYEQTAVAANAFDSNNMLKECMTSEYKKAVEETGKHFSDAKEMQELYKIVQTRLPAHILQRNDMKYEMREIEGGLCEFDKYSRIFKGEGRTRSIYKQNSLPIVEDLINGESKYG